MPSPFPGMNPYLEQDDVWEDFHHNFITYMGAQLSALVGDRYIVKTEVRLYLHELSAEERRYAGRADVAISRPASGSSTAVAIKSKPPLQLSLPAVDIEKQSYLEIRDRHTRQIVTVIELLSPTNKKPGSDRKSYLYERMLLLRKLHFVEIDLRRGGMRPQPPVIPPCHYCVLIGGYEEWPDVGVWPIALSDRLPTIPIPLSAPDPDVDLDLQSILHCVYDEFHYSRHVYGQSPQPPLTAEEAAWAGGFMPNQPSPQASPGRSSS